MPERDGLITTTELAGVLHQPDLRLFDCTTYLEYQPEGSGVPYIAVPGRHTFEAGHIPGADFLDLQGEFSDQTTGLRFMMPGVAQLEAAFGRHGVGNASRVVLYSIGSAMWATRFWWMLKSVGYEGASVLDGGLDKWKAEGRAIETGPAKGYPPAAFTAKPKPGYFVDSRETLKASTNRNAVVVPVRSGNQGLCRACRRREKIRKRWHHERQARGRLLRRRHLGDDRPVSARPTRLRQPHPL